MRIFIVHAHHEPKSFNGAMTETAGAALSDAGHEVIVSDLYRMAFDPVSDRRNFTTVRDAAYLKQQAEESFAHQHHGFAPPIAAELEKLFWCEALIFQFPLWWFGLPAILKGWVDRVFALGPVYGGGRRYDKGVLAGRRAMCALTTGGTPGSYGENGLNGEIGALLYPINHGIFAFTGFTVVEPFVVYGPVRLSESERVAELARYRARVLDLAAAPTLAYPRLEEYDEAGALRAAPPVPLG
jgi:NAD(P)H dehydrogenase (quinone)